MQQLVRKRLAALLLPLLFPIAGLLVAAVWMGARVATHIAQHPAHSPAFDGVLWSALPALLVLIVCAVMVHGALRKTVVPWLNLAQSVQARAPKDLQPMQVDSNAPAEVQAMTQALNTLLARASAESDAQQRFIADAAHQLRTPLAAVQSQVEAWALMAQAAPDQRIVLQAAQVDHLRRATRRTTQLANQLLVLSRLDSGLAASETMQRVDLQSLCETLLASFLDSALVKEIDLGLEATPAHVTGHEWSLRELISNLLDNAIKYTPAGGQVTLRCGRCTNAVHNGLVYVEVEDNGVGVPVREYTRLTQRFYRAPGVQGAGTGLGLAIAQEIAQAHGAKLQFGAGISEKGLRVQLIFSDS